MMDIPDKAGIEVHIATKDELQSFFLDFLIAQREFSPEKLEEEVKRLNKNQEQYIQYPLDFHDWIA
jgi:benzoyl-CoA reductase/2-hydroxyglutaryl-CoA dehydratase subunit BcrC/BadD/HgdB